MERTTEFFIHKIPTHGGVAQVEQHYKYTDEINHPIILIMRDFDEAGGEGVYIYKLLFKNRTICFREVHTGAYVTNLIDFREEKIKGTTRNLAKKLFQKLKTVDGKKLWTLLKNFDENRSLATFLINLLK